MPSKKSASSKDGSQPVKEGTDAPSNPQTEKSESSKDGLQPVKGDTDAPSDQQPVEGDIPVKPSGPQCFKEDFVAAFEGAAATLELALPVESPPEALDAAAALDAALEAEKDVDFGNDSDDDEQSSAWTDEDEHMAWKAMTITQRFKHVSAMKRKLAWHAEAQGASLQDGLQPAAQNDQLPADMPAFLQECNLVKFSHL